VAKDRKKKVYKPRDRTQLKLRHDPWRLKSTFDPLLAIVDQLEKDGTLTVEVQNGVEQPVFRDLSTGQLSDTAGAMAGFIELFELFETRFNKPLPLDPLRVLYKRIIDGEMIDSTETRAVREAAGVMYTACLDITIAQADELVQDYMLKEALNGNMLHLVK
jgi:hypothetical protein